MSNSQSITDKKTANPYISPWWALLIIPAGAALILSDAFSTFSGTFSFGTSEASLYGWILLSGGLCFALPALGTAVNLNRWHAYCTGALILLSGLLTMKSTESDFSTKAAAYLHGQQNITRLKQEAAGLQESIAPKDPNTLPCERRPVCDSKAEKARLAQINDRLAQTRLAANPEDGLVSGWGNYLIMVLRAFAVPAATASLGHLLGYIFLGLRQNQQKPTSPGQPTPPNGSKRKRSGWSWSWSRSKKSKPTPQVAFPGGVTASSNPSTLKPTADQNLPVPEATHDPISATPTRTHNGVGRSSESYPSQVNDGVGGRTAKPTQTPVIVNLPEPVLPEINLQVPVEINLPESPEEQPKVGKGDRVVSDPGQAHTERYGYLVKTLTQNRDVRLSVESFKKVLGCGQSAAQRCRDQLVLDGYVLLQGNGRMVATAKLTELREKVNTKPQLRLA
jgi:hypothetical protein